MPVTGGNLPVPTSKAMDLPPLIKHALNGCDVYDTLLSYFLQPSARANGDKSETSMSVWTSVQEPELNEDTSTHFASCCETHPLALLI